MFKILVVEDDKELNRTVCAFLNQSGYEAVGCFDAVGAYDAMYKNTFDLIVSDIMMPGVDGYEFAKTVRSLNEDIPILFMTARFGEGKIQVFRRAMNGSLGSFVCAAMIVIALTIIIRANKRLKR